jgi:LysM domain-containing protein
MIKPPQIATIIAGAMLSACLFLLDLDPATAGPVAAPGVSATPPPAAIEPGAVPHMRAYLFRGALGPIFSRGMDHLAEEIRETGIPATVDEFTICRLIAESAIREYRKDPALIILIGHSMGGFCVLEFSQMLQANNIPVSLAVTIDPPQISPPVPSNIERYLNIFLSKSVLGGSHIKPAQDYHSHFASFDLSERKEVSHFNIDKEDVFHRQFLAKIGELTTTPANVGGAPARLNYVVPPDAEIELWDTGTPAFARPGDTLQTIAELYRVPLWSLTQANKGLMENAPLVPGERIVVPRYLTPPTGVSRPAPAGR